MDAEALRDDGAIDIDDVASQLASFSTTNLGPGRDKILLRGLSDGVFTGRTQSTVGIYLDDVPITYNAPDPDLHLGDLDKIEVAAARGPQGTLYGGGSMSGIYRIVTRKPELDEFSGSVRGGVATTDAAAGLERPGRGHHQRAPGQGPRGLAGDGLPGRGRRLHRRHQSACQDQIDSTMRTGGRAYLRDWRSIPA